MAIKTFGSVCSGIEAASVAWEPLGLKASWLSEIEKFPSRVLAHHWPDVPNLGDMTALSGRILSGQIDAPDMLVGGTPCQAFSVAGLRNSLDDGRGQLTLEYVRLLNAIDAVRRRNGKPPAVCVWENVPGVLTTKDNAFGCFLGALAGENCELQPAGRKWSNAGCVFGPERAVAWRVLDAQYFGVAQRRRRVFVVASARAGFDPAAVLFERESLRRDTKPSRETWEEVAGTLAARTTGGGFPGTDEALSGYVQPCMMTNAEGSNGATLTRSNIGKTLNNQTPLIVHGTQDPCVSEGTAFALGRNNGGENVLAFKPGAGAAAGSIGAGGNISPTLTASDSGTQRAPAILQGDLTVRRLTPVECERLQGFPDNHTLIPDWYDCKCGHSFSEDLGKYGCPNCEGDNTARLRSATDGHRYKAIGNSMAVPVMHWIGRRLLNAHA
jgi:DNA (cytosine-5)-methyltransferase 1